MKMIDFFLNPDVAYLFLVAGFSLALLAIITPGTGLLEIAALFILLLAGWGIYSLPINYWALIVLLISVFLFIWAVRKSGQLIYLGLSLLALVLGSAYLFRSELWWKPAVNPFLALVVSVLAVGFFWIVARKSIEANAAVPLHDLSELIGALGEAQTEIHHEGSVQVQKELWSARSVKPIKPGAIVRVLARDGFILEVEEINE
jgi:membrane-bound serine protease (ClpP class)